MQQNWFEPDWDPGLSIQNLPLKHFLEKGLKAIILDVDGTLIQGQDVLLHRLVKDWIIKAKPQLKLHLLSNNPSRKRIATVAEQVDLTFTFRAAKPRRGALIKVIEQLQLNPGNIAIVGDRIFTDVLAGNRLGLYTVLVKPLNLDSCQTKNFNYQRLEQRIARFLGANQR